MFVAICLLTLAAINMGFGQGQQNPDAENFFESKSEIVNK